MTTTVTNDHATVTATYLDWRDIAAAATTT